MLALARFTGDDGNQTPCTFSNGALRKFGRAQNRVAMFFRTRRRAVRPDSKSQNHEAPPRANGRNENQARRFARIPSPTALESESFRVPARFSRRPRNALRKTAKSLTGHTDTHILTYLYADEKHRREAMNKREGKELKKDLIELYNQIKNGNIDVSVFVEKVSYLIKNG